MRARSRLSKLAWRKLTEQVRESRGVSSVWSYYKPMISLRARAELKAYPSRLR